MKENTIKDYLNKQSGKGPYSYNKDNKLPNILMITMDMVPPEFYKEGNSLKIPCQKKLREDSVSFSNAFAASPLCGPSRASLLTGRYPYITGNSERSHDGHKTELRLEDIIWPEYLKAMGYHTRHVGKSHVGTEHFMRAFTENCSPWDRWSPPWYSEDQYIEFLNDKGLDRFTFKKEIRGESWNGERKGNSYGGWLADQKGKPFPEDGLYPSFLVNKAINTLKTRESDKAPFYLQLDFFGPHQPFAIPGGWENRESEIRKAIELPQSWLEWESQGFPEESDDPRVYDMYRKNWGLRNREDMTDYCVANQLQYEILDSQVDKLIQYLKDNDLYDSTMIIFTADHGEMNGRKGCIDKGAYLNPQVLKVPLVLKPSAGQNISASSVNRTPCSLLDIFPTIGDVTGLSVSERVDGVSLFSIIRENQRPDDKPVMFDVWNHVVPNPCIGSIIKYKNEDYLYSYNCTSEKDELYRLSEEGELNNLIDDEKLRIAALKRMHKLLSNDPRWDIYNGYFKLENGRTLNLTPGDNQKFE